MVGLFETSTSVTSALVLGKLRLTFRVRTPGAPPLITTLPIGATVSATLMLSVEAPDQLPSESCHWTQTVRGPSGPGARFQSLVAA